jgi:hypothetical protein
MDVYYQDSSSWVRGIYDNSYNSSVNRGIEILTEELVTTAPEFFNFETPEGRAAIVAAHIIAGGEITGVLPQVVRDRSLLYRYMGGSGNAMRGWAQFNTYYFNPRSAYRATRMSFDPVSYNRKMGRILYGIDPRPTGRGYFNLNGLVKFLESGRTGEEVRLYLARQFSIHDWHGIHEPGGGAARIRRYRIGDQSLAMLFPLQFAQRRGIQVAKRPQEVIEGGVGSGVRRKGMESTGSIPRLLNVWIGTPQSPSQPISPPKTIRYSLLQKIVRNGKEQVVARGYLEIKENKLYVKSSFPIANWEDLLKLSNEEIKNYYVKDPIQKNTIPLAWVIGRGETSNLVSSIQ